MPGAAASDENLSRIWNRGAGETSARREHRSEEAPRGSAEVKSEDRGGRRGAVDRKRTSVEERAADDVEMGPNGEGGEVAESVDVGVAGHGREGAPG